MCKGVKPGRINQKTTRSNRIFKTTSRVLIGPAALRKEGNAKRIEIKEKERFKIIYKMAQRKKNKLNISYMCNIAGVSKSGYYRYANNLISDVYLLREENDKEDFELIMKAYKFKNRVKGARGINMTLKKNMDYNECKENTPFN